MPHVRLSDLSLQFTDGGSLLVRSQSHGIAARVPPPAVAVLAFCAEPRTRDEVRLALGPPMLGLFDGLIGAGFLVEPDKARGTPSFFHNFAGLEIHRRMLGDTVRVDAYHRAIVGAVKPGMVVMDAGAGSGLLACLAAKAGARKVYAVDNSDVLDLARSTILHNGLHDVIALVRADFGEVVLPEKVDLIVSETFGAFALAEGSVPDLSAAVSRNLEPGGRVVPDGVSLHLAPVGDLDLHRDTLDPFGLHHGLDFAPLRQAALTRGRVVDVDAERLLHPGRRLVHLPYPSETKAEGSLALPLSAGTLTGLAAWFDVHDGEHLMFSTGPAAPHTHWRQAYLPLPALTVAKGEVLELDVAVLPTPDDRRSIEVDTTWRVGRHHGQVSWRLR